MFSTKIIDSDAFMDMPASAQSLYFHLCMRADDEGFVGNPKKIMRMIGVNEDDFKVLLAKRFILSFESGIVVIKHWLIHNTIRMDRFNPTSYQEEKKLIITKENKAYTEWQPVGNQLATQVKLSKVNLIKDKSIESMSAKADAFNQFWLEYPKKELKKKTLEIWNRKKLDSSLEVILDFISSAKNTDRWKKGFIKQPPVFLNGECWNDDLSSYKDNYNSRGKSVAIIK
jgi:hypothetical protein